MEEIDLAELEVEIQTFSARVAVSTCRYLLAVGEYDRRRGWETWECHDMAGWLSWKCGISPVTAREQVRVARGLGHFARVRELFAAGSLSYSQVRAILRVATPASEESLLELARVSTAAQLERICRGVRRCRRVEEDSEAGRDAGRYVRFHHDDDGCVVGSFRLAPETGAVLARALEGFLSRQAVTDADRDGARDPHGAVMADGLVELIEAGHVALADPARDDDSRYLLTLVAEAETLAGVDDPAEPGDCQIDDGAGLAVSSMQRLSCDCDVITIREDRHGEVLDVGRRTRKIPRGLRRALRHRDHGCRWPGCDRTRVQGHHIRHWSNHGETNLANLMSLCWRHHRRLHEGGYRVEHDGQDNFRFYHPAGYEFPAAASPPTISTWIDDGYQAPYQPDWDGTRLDLPTIIEGILAQESPTPAT